MDSFLSTSKRISQSLDTLEGYRNDYRRLTRSLNTSVQNNQEERILLKNIQEVGIKFKNLSASIKDRIIEASTATQDPQNKIIEFHIRGHSRRLLDLINQFREIQFEFKKSEENRIKTLYKAANSSATEDEVGDYLDNPGSNTKVYALYTLGDNSRKLLVDEAMRRQEEIKKINRYSEEIVEITRIIAETIFEKSSVIDNLADDIISTEENMARTNAELEKTLKYKIRRRKFWRNVLLFIFICLLLYLSFYVIKHDYFGWSKKKD